MSALREQAEQALRFLDDALEATGEEEDDLIREETSNVFVRVVCARDVLRAALTDGDPSPGHSVRVPPRTPQIGERWLHDRLGEVEVLDTSTYRPDGAEWLVVQKRLGEDKRRWSVPPTSLIGRAE